MERLTIMTPKGAALKMDATYPNETAAKKDLMKKYLVAVDRLAAYEDTGLEPVEIITGKELAEIACAMNLLKKYQEIGSPDRLRELAQADKEGRCIVLPTESINARYDVADMLADFKEEAEYVDLSVGIFGITWAESEMLQSIINALNLGREVDEKH